VLFQPIFYSGCAKREPIWRHQAFFHVFTYKTATKLHRWTWREPTSQGDCHFKYRFFFYQFPQKMFNCKSAY